MEYRSQYLRFPVQRCKIKDTTESTVRCDRSEIYHIVNFALLSNMTVAKENIVLLRQTQRKPEGDTSPIFYADKILN